MNPNTTAWVWMRRSLGGVLAALLMLGPYDAELLGALSGLGLGPHGVAVNGAVFALLRGACVLAGVGYAVGLWPRLMSWSAALLFLAFNGLVASVTPFWNYNTHLNFFLFGMGWGETAPRYRAAVLNGMRLFIGWLYFQAGLSKLLFAGPAWALTGRTLFTYALVLEGPLGGWVAHHPALSPWLAVLGLGFELVFLPLLVLGVSRRALGGAGLLFHLGIWLVLGISFWHLCLLYPALFLMRSSPTSTSESNEENTRARRAPCSRCAAACARKVGLKVRLPVRRRSGTSRIACCFSTLWKGTVAVLGGSARRN
jgi:hypothetical protein